MAISSVISSYTSPVYAMKKNNTASTGEKRVPKEISEHVEISQEGKEAIIPTLKEVVKNAPEVRLPLVKEIEAKIATGDYPLESKLSEAVKRLIQARVFNQ